MFNRVTKRAKRREQTEQLGVANKTLGISGIEDTDSDESDSDDGSSDEGQNEDATGPKRSLGGEEEEEEEEEITGVTDEEVSDEEDTTALSSMTVKEALKSSIEDKNCILCPGKNLKNNQMEHVHLQSQHHQRRLKRFEALVERLSSQFEDVFSDQAALIVRLLGKPSIGQNDGAGSVRSPEAQSKRAIKKRRLAAKKEKRKRKRDALGAQDEEKGNPAKRRKPSHGAKLAKGKASSP